MNESDLETTKQKIRNLTFLTCFLNNLREIKESELLKLNTREKLDPIIKEVMEKMNEMSKQ